MIEIEELNVISSEIEEFQKREWEFAEIKHFGRIVDWKKETKILKATDKGELIGILELTIQAGVMHIDSLIVAQKTQRRGIGRSLVLRAEEIARKHKLHKIYLDTGKSWPSVKFYASLGYENTGELPMHLGSQDYVTLSKFLR